MSILVRGLIRDYRDSVFAEVGELIDCLRGFEDKGLRYLVDFFVYFFFFNQQGVRRLSAMAWGLKLFFRCENRYSFEGNRSGRLISTDQTLNEVLADFFNKLLGIVRAFESLELHKADESTPVACSDAKLVSELVIGVQTLDHYHERLHLNLAKRVVLTEAAPGQATLGLEEALAFKVVEGVVVYNVARRFLEDVDLHLAGTGRLVSSSRRSQDGRFLFANDFRLQVLWFLETLSLEPHQVVLVVQAFLD